MSAPTSKNAILKRHTAERRSEAWLDAELHRPGTRFIPLVATQNLIVEDSRPHAVLLSRKALGPLLNQATEIVFLGEKEGTPYFALSLAEQDFAQHPLPGELRHLRRIIQLLGREEANLLAYARAMSYWHTQHRYCGHCGSPTRSAEGGHLRVCTAPDCGIQHFPRTDPAIIVLVSSERGALLGRQPTWPPHLYSTIAGFVEPGEQLEEAVAREVWEETGVKVEAPRYRASQPWPFPGALMLGFQARARTETIRCHDEELETARWFSRWELQEALERGTLRLPSPASIAYRLIREWYHKRAGD